MYCKNCGSILQNNANFCHVCGTKVDYDDVFNKPEEPKPQEDVRQEAPSYSEPVYQSYYDAYDGVRPEEADKPSKKPLVPALIGTLGSLFIMGDAGLIYMTNMLQFNEYYSKGVISYSDYIGYVASLFRTIGLYFILAAILGLVLGTVASVFSHKQKHKKGFIFGIAASCLGVISLVLAIVIFVFYFRIA